MKYFDVLKLVAIDYHDELICAYCPVSNVYAPLILTTEKINYIFDLPPRKKEILYAKAQGKEFSEIAELYNINVDYTRDQYRLSIASVRKNILNNNILIFKSQIERMERLVSEVNKSKKERENNLSLLKQIYLDDTALSSRVKKSLRNEGYTNLFEINSLSDRELLKIKDFGRKSLEEVKSLLNSFT